MTVTERYLELVKQFVCNYPQLYEEPSYEPDKRKVGLCWPAHAWTMIGRARLDFMHRAAREVLADKIPGDFIEAGVWRGGTCVFLRACQIAYGQPGRKVWLADSFCGLPPPDPKHPLDAGDNHHTIDYLRVTQREVAGYFARIGLLDDGVQFLPGWFAETLPRHPPAPLALVRLDGDMHESTMTSLEHLYPRLSVGGWLVLDDIDFRGVKGAIEEYRTRHGITTSLVRIDWSGMAWRKEA